MQFNDPQELGGFMTSREFIGHTVLFVAVREERMRFNELAGEDRREVLVDYVDIDAADPALVKEAWQNSPFIAEKLKAGQAMVLGVIDQLPSKKKGQQGAIIFRKADDAGKAKAAEVWTKIAAAGFDSPAEDEDPLAKAVAAASG